MTVFTPPPIAPNRSDPATFPARADAYVVWWATIASELNAVFSAGSTPVTALTVNGDLTITDKIIHAGDTNTYLQFFTNQVRLSAGGTEQIILSPAGGVDVAVSIDMNDNSIFDINNLHFDTSASGDYITWETMVGLKGYENGAHVWTLPHQGDGKVVVTSNSDSYIGSIAMVKRTGAATAGYFVTIAGSNLQASDAAGNASGDNLSGTWRILGRLSNTDSVTIAVRIA